MLCEDCFKLFLGNLKVYAPKFNNQPSTIRNKPVCTSCGKVMNTGRDKSGLKLNKNKLCFILSRQENQDFFRGIGKNPTNAVIEAANLKDKGFSDQQIIRHVMQPDGEHKISAVASD